MTYRGRRSPLCVEFCVRVKLCAQQCVPTMPCRLNVTKGCGWTACGLCCSFCRVHWQHWVTNLGQKSRNARSNVTFMLFFRFRSRKCFIISHYIAIYWIFLRIFARIFRGRTLFSYLAVNDADDVREDGVEQWAGEKLVKRGHEKKQNKTQFKLNY